MQGLRSVHVNDLMHDKLDTNASDERLPCCHLPAAATLTTTACPEVGAWQSLSQWHAGRNVQALTRALLPSARKGRCCYCPCQPLLPLPPTSVTAPHQKHLLHHLCMQDLRSVHGDDSLNGKLDTMFQRVLHSIDPPKQSTGPARAERTAQSHGGMSRTRNAMAGSFDGTVAFASAAGAATTGNAGAAAPGAGATGAGTAAATAGLVSGFAGAAGVPQQTAAAAGPAVAGATGADAAALLALRRLASRVAMSGDLGPGPGPGPSSSGAAAAAGAGGAGAGGAIGGGTVLVAAGAAAAAGTAAAAAAAAVGTGAGASAAAAGTGAGAGTASAAGAGVGGVPGGKGAAAAGKPGAAAQAAPTAVAVASTAGSGIGGAPGVERGPASGSGGGGLVASLRPAGDWRKGQVSPEVAEARLHQLVATTEQNLDKYHSAVAEAQHQLLLRGGLDPALLGCSPEEVAAVLQRQLAEQVRGGGGEGESGEICLPPHSNRTERRRRQTKKA